MEVIAYKGMKSNMTCRNFQYEIGKTYKTDKAELCECGFHACLNPRDVLDYYPKNNSRYFRVKLSGEITKCGFEDTKVAATEITILEEINIDELLNTTTRWWENYNVLDLLYWSDGFAKVKNCERKYNFISNDGKLLSREWFNWVGGFNDGFAKVQRTNGECNFIGKDGKYLNDEWFYNVYSFVNGFVRVKITNGEWCKIDKTGNLIKNL